MKNIPMIIGIGLLTAAAQPVDPDAEDDPFAPQEIEQVTSDTAQSDGNAQGQEDDGGRIIGGDKAPPGSAPWQVQLFSPTIYTDVQRKADAKLPRTDSRKKFLNERASYDISHRCGASYIGDGWIITAAHCANDDAITYRRVRIGTQNIARGGKTYRIDTVVLHKGYRSNDKHDIALIHINSKNRPLPPSVEKITLSSPSDNAMRNGETLHATGWGMTGAQNTSTNLRLDHSGGVQYRPPNLLQVDLVYFSPTRCQKFPQFKGKVHSTILCAGSSDGRDTCVGDSGGPLVRYQDKWVLVGIVSWGVGCGIKGLPGIYTRVSQYSDWIKRAKTMPRGTHKIF